MSDEGSYYFMNPYRLCLNEAKKCSMRDGNADGAVAHVIFDGAGLIVFKNRNRLKCDIVEEYGLRSCGFQEHAEEAVLNDIRLYVMEYNAVPKMVSLFIAGYYNNKPYYYKDPKGYSCMNCACYLYDWLPKYSSSIMLPSGNNTWWVLEPYQLYKAAVDLNSVQKKPSEYRRTKILGVLKSANTT